MVWICNNYILLKVLVVLRNLIGYVKWRYEEDDVEVERKF